MRGRHSAAILTRIGITETIAESIGDYVALAVALANDPPRLSQLRRRMRERKGRAYQDTDYIRGLESFLAKAVADAAHNEDERAAVS